MMHFGQYQLDLISHAGDGDWYKYLTHKMQYCMRVSYVHLHACTFNNGDQGCALIRTAPRW